MSNFHKRPQRSGSLQEPETLGIPGLVLDPVGLRMQKFGNQSSPSFQISGFLSAAGTGGLLLCLTINPRFPGLLGAFPILLLCRIASNKDLPWVLKQEDLYCDN